MKKRLTLTVLAAATLVAAADTQILVNQVGYYPNQEKYAVVSDAATDHFSVTDSRGNTILDGEGLYTATTPWSGVRRTIMDFSAVTEPGTYTLRVGDHRAEFAVRPAALSPLADAALRSLYYQRTAMPIEERYGGQWSRPSGHPDTCVLVHPSAAGPGRPAGTVISSPGGWYDAGDYNKYIVNSAFTIGQLLALYRLMPDYFAGQRVGVPESDNDTPDLLDEVYYNLRWMLTMQDPADGGVYHKLTTPNFEAFVAPSDCHQPRYVVQKSVTAALDFAAVMAQASRIYRRMPDYPALADQALDAARRAFAWAQKYPREYYVQSALNARFDPDINTGEYGDRDAADEFFWAASELYQATGDKAYRKVAMRNRPTSYTPPVWGNTAGLGVLAWLAPHKGVSKADAQMAHDMFAMLIDYCDHLQDGASRTAFHAPYGNRPDDFFWGSLAERCAGQAYSLCIAYVLTGNRSYLTNAARNLNYILGINPLGYCYVTGFGTHPPMHPHHRLSASDGIDAPLPGFLVGGPNAGRQDGVSYASTDPDMSYADVEESYASNEVAINWSSALVAVASAIDYLMSR